MKTEAVDDYEYSETGTELSDRSHHSSHSSRLEETNEARSPVKSKGRKRKRKAAEECQDSLKRQRQDRRTADDFTVSVEFSGDPWDIWGVEYSDFDWEAVTEKISAHDGRSCAFSDWEQTLLEYGIMVQLYRKEGREMSALGFLQSSPTGRSGGSCESICKVGDLIIAHPVWTAKQMVKFLEYLGSRNFTQKQATKKWNKREMLTNFLVKQIFTDKTEGEQVFRRWYDILCYSRRPENLSGVMYLPWKRDWVFDQYASLLHNTQRKKWTKIMDDIRKQRFNNTANTPWPTKQEVEEAKRIFNTDYNDALITLPSGGRVGSRVVNKNKYDFAMEETYSDDDDEIDRKPVYGDELFASPSAQNGTFSPFEDSPSALFKSRDLVPPPKSNGASFKLSDPEKLGKLILVTSKFGFGLRGMEEGGAKLVFGMTGGREVTLKDVEVGVEVKDGVTTQTWDKHWEMFSLALTGLLYNITNETS